MRTELSIATPPHPYDGAYYTVARTLTVLPNPATKPAQALITH
jgi:hypothetical protein